MDEETANHAVDMTKEVKDLYNKIEDQRKIFVKEPNKYVKEVNQFAKAFTSKLEEIERIVAQAREPELTMDEKWLIQKYTTLQEGKKKVVRDVVDNLSDSDG